MKILEFFSFNNKTTHIGNVGIRGKKNDEDYFDNNLIERLQDTIRERNKTQRGLKDRYSLFVRGHQLYYNFIKPHESLYGSTPANMAGINLNLKEKRRKNLLMQSLLNKSNKK